MADGRVIVVTGASSGIGRELALQLSGPGVELWLVGRDQKRLADVASLVEGKGATARVASMDLADIANATRFLEANFPEGKRVDEVYLSAAITMFGEVKDTFGSDWCTSYQTNLLSPVQWTLHFYRGMVVRGCGRIVMISSLAGHTGYPTAAGYATMKAGLVGLHRSLVHEGRFHGVQIHLASPGYVDTPIYERALYRNASYERVMAQIRTLGFKVISASEAAKRTIAGARKGRLRISMPFYSRFFIWLAPRVPFVIDLIHARILRTFRQAS